MTSRTLILSTCPHQELPPSFEGYKVLTPNSRAAATLGVPFVSLEMHARKTLRSAKLLIASELTQLRVLRKAVYEVLAPEDLQGTTRALTQSVREVLRAGLEAAHLQTPLPDRPQRILALVEHYRKLLHEMKFVDPAEALWVASRLRVPREQVLVTGYPRVGYAELAYLDALATPGSMMVLPTGNASAFSLSNTTAQYLTTRGWQVERHERTPFRPGEVLGLRLSEPKASIRNIDALRFASQEEEVRFILTEVKSLLRDGTPADDIVLVVRDEASYAPLLKAIAWEYDLPVKAFYGVPLRDTRFGAWLDALANVLRDSLPFESTARLLTHPLCTVLDQKTWEKVRVTHPQGLTRWLDIAPELACLAWPAEATRQIYAEHLSKTLNTLHVRERAVQNARDNLALHKLQRALGGLSSPADEALPLTHFLRDLQDLLALFSVPADPPHYKGVALHTPLAVFGTHYEHVFVLGAAEGLFPATLRDEPPLDFYERKTLNNIGLRIEGAIEAAHRESLSFWAVLDTVVGSLILSYPELIGSQANIESPYFSALGIKPQSAPKKAPASKVEARHYLLQSGNPDDPVLVAAQRGWEIERQRESDASYDNFDGVIGEGIDPFSRTFSASQLVVLGQCPFRWFSERLLHLKEPDEAEDDISPLFIGRLYHKTLEAVLNIAKNASNPREAALAALETAFVSAEETEGVPNTPTWPLQRQSHLRQLRKVLLSDNFIPNHTDIIDIERHFNGIWRGLKVRGIIDRVDQDTNGLIFIDYKTRSSKPPGAQDRYGKATVDVQLPLYLEAAAPVLYPGQPVKEAYYFSLTKATLISKVDLDQDTLEDLASRAKRALQEGRYPIAPDVDGHACRTCQLDLVCRKGPRLERKRQGGSA